MEITMETLAEWAKESESGFKPIRQWIELEDVRIIIQHDSPQGLWKFGVGSKSPYYHAWNSGSGEIRSEMAQKLFIALADMRGQIQYGKAIAERQLAVRQASIWIAEIIKRHNKAQAKNGDDNPPTLEVRAKDVISFKDVPK